MVETVNAASREELEEASCRCQVVIAKILAPYVAELKQSELSPKTLAEFVQRSARTGEAMRNRSETPSAPIAHAETTLPSSDTVVNRRLSGLAYDPFAKVPSRLLDSFD